MPGKPAVTQVLLSSAMYFEVTQTYQSETNKLLISLIQRFGNSNQVTRPLLFKSIPEYSNPSKWSAGTRDIIKPINSRQPKPSCTELLEKILMSNLR